MSNDDTVADKKSVAISGDTYARLATVRDELYLRGLDALPAHVRSIAVDALKSSGGLALGVVMLIAVEHLAATLSAELPPTIKEAWEPLVRRAIELCEDPDCKEQCEELLILAAKIPAELRP